MPASKHHGTLPPDFEHEPTQTPHVYETPEAFLDPADDAGSHSLIVRQTRVDDNLVMHESVEVYVETRGLDTLEEVVADSMSHDTPGVRSCLKTWCRMDMNPEQIRCDAGDWRDHMRAPPYS